MLLGYKNCLDLCYFAESNVVLLGLHTLPGDENVACFVFLSVMLLNGKMCSERKIAVDPFNVETILILLDSGRFVVVL